MIGSFHQRFIWRVAGFPCEALEAFALPALAERVEELAKAAGDGRTLWPQRWSRLRDHPQLPQLERQFDDALAQLRFDLAHLARSERFQLAVTCSSPAAAVRLASMGSAAGEKRRSKHKRLELLAMRYLQRLVTKCETAAFFGPIATGGFGTVECGVESRFVPSSYRGVAFVGDRWLGSIVKLLRRLPRVMLSLRVHRRSGIGRLGLEHGAILLPGRGLWRPAAAAMAVVAAAGKPMRVEDLIADLGGDSMKTLQVVQALVAVGVLSDELDSVWQVADPIRYLRQIATRAGELPAALGTLLDLLEQSLKRWPEADAAACRGLMSDLTAAAQACGISAGSGGGFYSDRMAIVEDGLCHDANLRLDRGWAEPFLADLEQLLRERMAADACRLVALRRKLASALRRGDERWRPFGEVLAEMAADESLRQGEPEPAETSPAPAAAGDLGPLVASPDVMLAAANIEDLRRGNCQWVLSECHRSVGCAGFFVRPMPDRKRWLAEISAFLADALSPSQPVLITQPMHNKTCRLGHLPCVRYLEVGLGAPPEGTTVEMDEIAMTLDDEPGLVLRETAQPIVVLPPGLARPSFADRVFDPPSFRLLPAAGAGRRVVSRSILVTRASWELPGKNLIGPHASAWEVFVWAQSERARNRLPRWIFVHPKSELKPMCIDFANPFLCEELLRLLRRDQELLIREMVPSPAEAWVTSPDGRHLSEIRLLYAAGR